MKVRKWIDTPDVKQYDQFISDWHYFLKQLRAAVRKRAEDSAVKEISMYLLKLFYMLPYAPERAFYGQFYERFDAAQSFAEEFLKKLEAAES